MNRGIRNVAFLISLISLTPLAGRATTPQSATAKQRPTQEQYASKLSSEVGHQLRLLPYYSVFDNLEYSINGDTVSLLGQVANPTVKSDAESAVKRIEGVAHVENHIEVLPTSISDDQLRRQLFRAIYGDDVLQRYAIQAVPPIHIIVKGGHATLVGVVAREMEKDIAGIRAMGVHGVFSVDNQLKVEEQSGK
jgi:hyperosmotically inducible protein